MCRAHCHRIIKLSGTLDSFAPEKELVENVHGVRKSFLDFGLKLRPILEKNQGKDNPIFGPDASPKVYFIGKMLWSKGIGSLMELLNYAEESAGLHIDFDMYGGGPDLEEAKSRSEKLGLSMTYHGPIDHAKLAPSHKVRVSQHYLFLGMIQATASQISMEQIFVNPSLSEVLCTTVAEALAMGKFVVIPSHPSNDFFAQFPNCLTYANKEEFVGTYEMFIIFHLKFQTIKNLLL
jgi:digalactosyldiacylglycerol synthase